MTLLKIFALEDVKEENEISSLSEGEHIIGRGVVLNCNDKRISRKHALIIVCKDAVTIKAVHVNPCFFKAFDGKSITILTKDTSVDLSDGDQFALLADQFWFKVRVIINKDGEDADAINCIELKNPKDISDNNISTVSGNNTGTTNLDTSSNSVLTGKRCQEDSLTDICKRQKMSDTSDNEPTTSTSSDKNMSHKDASSRPLSPINSLDLLLDTSSNLEQSIGTNQLINSLNNIIEEDYGDIHISKGKVSEAPYKKEAVSDDEDQHIDNLNINNNATQVKKEKTDGNVEIKKEEEIESVEGTSDNKNKDSADDDSKDDQNKASCSKDNPNDKQSKKKSRRERCWYADTCYRKNPLHLTNFSHPGDDDFLSDPDDDRPECPFGDACYRTNLVHRRDYKHTSRPAPKPNDGGQKQKRKSPKKKPKTDDGNSDDDHNDDQNDDGARKKRKAAMKKLYADYDSADDDYDYNDPFIDDASSDEFQLSNDDDDDDDSTDWDDSQKVNEESQETRRLLKEAKRFTKDKPKRKD